MADKVKNGFLSSEFWLTLLAQVLGAFVASGLLGPDHIAMRVAGVAVSILAALGYTASRYGLKKGAEKTKQVRASTQPGTSPG
jgi:hypothetical protein